MAILSTNNIESELSYAYLHAVAAKAGMSCFSTPRHLDNIGIDAKLTFEGETESPYLAEIDIDVQLKATIAQPREQGDFLAYDFRGIEQFNNLCTIKSGNLKILVVLFLPSKPSEAEEWLTIDHDQLILKKAAYWVCLYKATKSENARGQVVYLPKSNLLTPEALTSLAKGPGATKDWPPYSTPQ